MAVPTDRDGSFITCAAFVVAGRGRHIPPLTALRDKHGGVVAIESRPEGAQILSQINGRRETRLLFDTILEDENALNLLTSHARSLSPIELVADEVSLSGELRGPLTKFLPIPILVEIHGDPPISQHDIVMAAASASVDARILWGSIEARIREWVAEYAVSKGTQGTIVPRAGESLPRGAKASEEIQNALATVDSAALDKFLKGAAQVSGGEMLPLLKALPLLPLGFLTRVALEHRQRVLEVSNLSPEDYSVVVRALAFAHVLELGLSVYCCPRHQDHPFAFLAVGQRAPPSAVCPTCEKSLPGLSYYHFEPLTTALLGRQGGIVEPLVWRCLESARASYASLVRVVGGERDEIDVIFLTRKGGYGVIECKTWLRRGDEQSVREQLRQALEQLESRVAMLLSRDIQVDSAILATNRSEANLERLVTSLIQERKFKSLAKVDVRHLTAKEIPQLKDLAKLDAQAKSGQSTS